MIATFEDISFNFVALEDISVIVVILSVTEFSNAWQQVTGIDYNFFIEILKDQVCISSMLLLQALANWDEVSRYGL